jgi:hypothetical protein
MDDGEFTYRSGAGQGAPKVLRRRDGGWAVAYDESGVTRIGRLVVIPDRTEFNSLRARFSVRATSSKRR